jgi:FAD binding domain
MGAQGLRVEAPGDLGFALKTALASGLPTVIDVLVAADPGQPSAATWELPPLRHPEPTSAGRTPRAGDRTEPTAPESGCRPGIPKSGGVPMTPSTGAPSQHGKPWDVVVIGGGNAGLVAAITARQRAPRVLLVERAQAAMRGGNTRHTRNIRCVHGQADAFTTGPYLAEELWRDLCGVGTGPSDEKLAGLTVRESETVPAWMTGHGVRWQRPLAGTLQLGRTNHFFLGGGKALVNTYHRTAARMGIAVCYGTTVEDLVIDGDRCRGLVTGGGTIGARAVVCASGGFEADLAWLRR